MNNFFRYIRDFLTDYLPNRRGRSPNTVKSYRDTLKLLIAFLREEKLYKLSQIDFDIFNTDLIHEFLDWLANIRKCVVSSINQRVTAIRSFFRYAADRDCTIIALSQDIDKRVRGAKAGGKLVGFLSESSLKVFLAQPDEKSHIGLRNLTFLVLLYDTGARCSEILQLKVRDLRLKLSNPEIFLMGKGKRPRLTPLTQTTVSHCERYLKIFHPDCTPQGDELLFYTVIHGKRNPMSPDTVAAFTAKYGEMARIICPEFPAKMTPHMMRHTRAMHFYREGMPRVLLAEYLGHADTQTTKIYAHADTEMKRKAMEKVDSIKQNAPEPIAIWDGDEEMIMKLSGLA
jgi:site-specific recombinase XerD